MAENLVIGAAFGYAREDLLPFVCSLRERAPSASCVLLVDARDTKDVAGFLQDEGVEFVAIDRHRTPARKFVHKLFIRVAPLAVIKNAYQRQSPRLERLVITCYKPSVSRYVLYRRLVAERPVAERVLLTDTRDVVFTGDPFEQIASTERETLTVALEAENHCIGNEPNNARWIRIAYGDHTLDRLRNNRISCSGTTMGTRTAIIHYLDAMNLEILRLRSKIGRRNGWDQGIHNFLVWNDLLRSVELNENCRDPIATLGLESAHNFIFDPATFRAEWADGGQICLMHQYDRHPELARAVGSATETYRRANASSVRRGVAP